MFSVEREAAYGIGSLTSVGLGDPGEPKTNVAALNCQKQDGTLTIKGSRDAMVIKVYDLQSTFTLASWLCFPCRLVTRSVDVSKPSPLKYPVLLKGLKYKLSFVRGIQFMSVFTKGIPSQRFDINTIIAKCLTILQQTDVGSLVWTIL